MQINASNVNQAEADWEQLRDEYLRQHGWQYTCQVPGSYWLWSGTLPDGRAVLCDEDTAFSIQQAMDPCEEEPADDTD